MRIVIYGNHEKPTVIHGNSDFRRRFPSNDT